MFLLMHRDFRFQPTSPVLKMGILPIDFSEIGLRNQIYTQRTMKV